MWQTFHPRFRRSRSPVRTAKQAPMGESLRRGPRGRCWPGSLNRGHCPHAWNACASLPGDTFDRDVAGCGQPVPAPRHRTLASSARAGIRPVLIQGNHECAARPRPLRSGGRTALTVLTPGGRRPSAIGRGLDPREWASPRLQYGREPAAA